MPARRVPPAARKPSPNTSPEERARAAIAKEDAVAGDKVRLTFRLVLARQDAEALSARAIREEKNIEGVVADILEQAVRGERSR